MDHPKLKREFLRSLAVKAYNETLGPEDVVPPALEFGEFPPSCSSIRPRLLRATLAERAKATFTVRKAMAEAQAQTKLKRALKHKSN